MSAARDIKLPSTRAQRSAIPIDGSNLHAPQKAVIRQLGLVTREGVLHRGER
jgi:hypothetical protein